MPRVFFLSRSLGRWLQVHDEFIIVHFALLASISDEVNGRSAGCIITSGCEGFDDFVLVQVAFPACVSPIKGILEEDLFLVDHEAEEFFEVKFPTPI